jgi:hypothetical protein
MEETRNAYRILVGNLLVNSYLEDQEYGRITSREGYCKDGRWVSGSCLMVDFGISVAEPYILLPGC